MAPSRNGSNSRAVQAEASTVSAKTSSEHGADKGNAVAEDEQLWMSTERKRLRLKGLDVSGSIRGAR